MERTHSIVARGEGWVGIVRGGTGLKVAHAMLFGMEHVTLTCNLHGASLLDETVALEVNHLLSLGAIEREGDRLRLRTTLPLCFDDQYLQQVIVHFFRQAAHMRTHSRQRNVIPAVSHYAD
ncbi:MAG: hypothetical protein ACKV2T_10560 [Kofleriaceae bacterium]